MKDVDYGEGTRTAEKRALFVQCERAGGALVATLVGPSIGQREAPIISHAVLAELNEPGSTPQAVVLDFGDVTFLNSMGLGMCIEIRNAMHKLGGKTILYRVSDQIIAVLKMTKMDRLYTIVGDRDKLDRALGR